MKVIFVGLGTEQLGISQLSSIIKSNGHEVGLAFSASLFHDRFNLEMPWLSPYFDDTKEVYKKIELENPEVLAFSPLTSTYQWALEVARNAKILNPNVKTVFGGVHASAVPSLVLSRDEVDYVVVGEGDIAFPKILDAIEKGDLSSPIVNTQFKSPILGIVRGVQSGFIQDLDSLPFLDKELWEEHVILGDIYMTMASRGCPYRCTFCFNNFFAKLPEEKSGKYVRLRSPEHVIAELKIAKKRYNIKRVDFEDDVFTTNKKWLEKFLYHYKKEINVPFQILTHPRYMDNDIAIWLREAGCEWVQMGVQSMDENFKKDTLMRYERSDDIALALDVMSKNGIHVKVDHMFGLPDEPISAQEMAREIYSKHTPKRIQTFWTCFLPGTEMMKDAVEKGRIAPEKEAQINEGIEFYFFRNTENIKDQKLMSLYKAYEVIYKFLPILPLRFRSKLTPELIQQFPSFLIRPLSLLIDIIGGFALKNPDFSWYAKHNLFQLKKFFARIIGIRVFAHKPQSESFSEGWSRYEKESSDIDNKEDKKIA